MDHPLADPRSLRSRRRLLPGVLIVGMALTAPTLLERPARAGSTMGAIVRAFCLSAFESELSQAGKTPPQGMANFACSCVEERLRSGSALDSAKQDCRQATARRFPI
jgi:hypothetical protein